MTHLRKWSLVLVFVLVFTVFASQATTTAYAYSPGRYETIKDNVPVWSAASSSSTRVGTIAYTGTCVDVLSISINSAGNYWGKIGTSRYVFMGNLKAHVHVKASGGVTTVSWSRKSDTQHTTTVATTATYCRCGYQMASASSNSYSENHTFGVSICTLCGSAKVASSPGRYDTVKDGVPVWSEPSSGSTQVQVLGAAGTWVDVVSVSVNGSGNYWGKIGSSRYIYMGNLKAHVHVKASGGVTTVKYSQKSNIQHTKVTSTTAAYCRCGYKMSSATSATTYEAHSFSGDRCTLCGAAAVSSTPGTYLTISANVPVWYGPSSTTTKVGTFADISTKVVVLVVTTNSAGNYWGKIGENRYVYMGNLIPGWKYIQNVINGLRNGDYDLKDSSGKLTKSYKVGNYYNTYITKPCTCYHPDYNHKNNTETTCTCRKYYSPIWNSGIQCLGFAVDVFDVLFAKYNGKADYQFCYYPAADLGNAQKLSSWFNANARPGDYLRYNWPSSGHSAIIYSMDSNGVWLYEGNSAAACKIAFSYRTFSYLVNLKCTSVTLRQAKNYPK